MNHRMGLPLLTQGGEDVLAEEFHLKAGRMAEGDDGWKGLDEHLTRCGWIKELLDGFTDNGGNS